jgi:hypothetical protein
LSPSPHEATVERASSPIGEIAATAALPPTDE